MATGGGRTHSGLKGKKSSYVRLSTHTERHAHKGSGRYCIVAIKSELTTGCSTAHNGPNKKEINSRVYIR